MHLDRATKKKTYDFLCSVTLSLVLYLDFENYLTVLLGTVIGSYREEKMHQAKLLPQFCLCVIGHVNLLFWFITWKMCLGVLWCPVLFREAWLRIAMSSLSCPAFLHHHQNLAISYSGWLFLRLLSGFAWESNASYRHFPNLALAWLWFL